MTLQRRIDEVDHHVLAGHEVVLLLETDPRTGLTPEEAGSRLETYGPNALTAGGRAGPMERFIRQFMHPLIYVLIVAGTAALALGETVDATVIFGVVLINAIIGFVQEAKAEASLDALRAMVTTRARVVRGGGVVSVRSEELVPGDLVQLEAGDKVPADLRLLEHAELHVDESALTGESVPVVKDEDVLPLRTAVADRRNMLYSGTLVTHGTCTAVVVATGAQTELGEIHRLVGTADLLATPLTRKLAEFSKVLTAVILALAALTFALGVGRGEDVGYMLTAAVALAVGAIPEGLPAAVTITMAIGVGRMARRGAIIRRLPAVETLGSTTVVCTDKTGTLTENQMTARRIWTPTAEYRLTGDGYGSVGAVTDDDGIPIPAPMSGSLRWTLLAGALCNDARLTCNQEGDWSVIGDPTEGALLAGAAKAGIDLDETQAHWPRVATIPFSSDRRWMATVHDSEDERDPVVLVKGAVERIVERCDGWLDADGQMQPIDGDRVLTAADDMAHAGMRVLATAKGHTVGHAGIDESNLPTPLSFTGLYGMLDPPRASAAAAVAACRSAGIEVKMMTGDHAGTARSIAAAVGIIDDEQPGQVMQGSDLEHLDDEAYDRAIAQARVIARVSPEQKLRLVLALQAKGDVVAMTGDGVNDAPALRQADIGVAMGKNGTEVAKEASDAVLTDDDFSTIEAAIEEGRGVFDNLTKFIVWTLPTNMGEGLVILAAIVVGASLPISPVQILWINMTTAVALGLMLAFEPKEPDIMARAPRDPHRPLLTRALVGRILLVSAVLVVASWWLFQWELDNGASLEEARTVAVNVFVMVELFYLFSCRSLTRPIWRIGFFSNHWLLLGVALQVVGQAAITYLPAMNALFGTAPITAEAWGRILLAACAASLIVAVDKRLRRTTLS